MIKYLKFLLPVLFIGCAKNSPGQSSEQGIISQNEIKGIEFTSNMIFLNIADSKGDTVNIYTDTGGGNLIYPETVNRLNLDIDTTSANGKSMELVNLNELFKRHDIPSTIKPHILFRGDSPLKEGNGGILGTNWFANKTWNFKYKSQKLFIIDSLNWDRIDKSSTVDIGFLKDENGNHTTHFPRIPIIVDQDTIQTLFDTGAHALLSEEAKPSFNNNKSVATSFIIAGIFDRWKSNHPDWETVAGADSLADEDMIKVPKIKIGNHEVGPVWFTRRADKNFTEYMSQWMDEKVHGAIGGSAFQYFDTIILDYNKELAFFDIR